MGTAPGDRADEGGTDPTWLVVASTAVALVVALALAGAGGSDPASRSLGPAGHAPRDGTAALGRPPAAGAGAGGVASGRDRPSAGGEEVATQRGRGGGGDGQGTAPSGGAVASDAGGAGGAGVGSLGSGRSDPASPSSARGRSGPGYVAVAAASGAGAGRSDPFELTGRDARLLVRSDGPLAVHLVDEAAGREAAAGYAELDCSGPCDEEHVLVAPSGRYRIEVDAAGAAWSVAVEEAEPPR